MTQKEAVLDYIKKHGTITPMEAWSHLGITKLATVVSELIRKDHVTIVKDWVTVGSRYNQNTTVRQYSFPREDYE